MNNLTLNGIRFGCDQHTQDGVHLVCDELVYVKLIEGCERSENPALDQLLNLETMDALLF